MPGQRSWRRMQCICAAALLGSVAAALEDECDRFEVGVGLSKEHAETLDGADQVSASQAGGKAVGVPFRRHRFSCFLPEVHSEEARRERARRANAYMLDARAAPLGNACYDGYTDNSEEVFQLCVGESVTFGGITAAHRGDRARVLDSGGFEQVYTGGRDGKMLRARVECMCHFPQAVLQEPRCSPGDTVLAPREGFSDHQPATVNWVGPWNEPAADGTVDSPESYATWLLVTWAKDPAAKTNKVYFKIDEVFTIEGEPCNGADPPPDTWGQYEASRLSGTYLGESPTGHVLDIRVGLPSCCSHQELRSAELRPSEHPGPDIGMRRLLSTLNGRCVTNILGWWSYELCWPWRLRILHHAVNGDAEAPGVTLGRLHETNLVMKKISPRSAAGRYQLVGSAEGDICETMVNTWSLQLKEWPEEFMNGVGGSFDPPVLGPVTGRTIMVASNVDGCTPFQERLDGMILLVARGNCWFQGKALNAQAAGAIAIVVYNEHQKMIEFMEGVPELSSPFIPTVLVEQHFGNLLKESVGDELTIQKAAFDGTDIAKPITANVVFRCSEQWRTRRHVCEPEDEVEVKVVDESITEPVWPNVGVRVLKATTVQVYREEGVLELHWPIQEEESEQEADELPKFVPMNMSYRNGIQCDAHSDAFIEEVAELQPCQFEIVVHVASLCSHPRMLPRQPPEPQHIACHAEKPTEVTAAREAWREAKEAEEALAAMAEEVERAEQAEHALDPGEVDPGEETDSGEADAQETDSHVSRDAAEL
eukprot:TRINITY_DN64668_c0_g1_i1.p1 TRINITY_DN64668_c0_g1~~TRINITY_DN64668_c0_g1_i1.p1  ORF type:complete len:765 (-),score=147.19 TRINITY_DN64668_c0_g1_i1:940-3234(-)